MKKQTLRLVFSVAATAFALVAAGLVPACLSSSSSATPDSGTAGAGGANGNGTSGDSGGTSSGPAGGGGEGGVISTANGFILDDMTQTETNTGGYWYTYDDRTVPNSEPPVLAVTDAGAPPGTVTPAEGAQFLPQTDMNGPMGGTLPYREFKGGGEKTWGAGCGLDFVDFLPDGGPVPLNMCDAGMIFESNAPADAGNVGIPQPFNLMTACAGGPCSQFVFWGRSFGTGNTTVWVQIAEKRTDPWAGTPGSTSMASCDPCKNGGMNACADDFRKSVLLTPTWTQYVIKFADMTRQDWSMTTLTPPTLDTSTAYYIHFQLTTNAGVALPNFDIGIADIVALP